MGVLSFILIERILARNLVFFNPTYAYFEIYSDKYIRLSYVILGNPLLIALRFSPLYIVSVKIWKSILPQKLDLTLFNKNLGGMWRILTGFSCKNVYVIVVSCGGTSIPPNSLTVGPYKKVVVRKLLFLNLERKKCMKYASKILSYLEHIVHMVASHNTAFVTTLLFD